jgi:hypothetical protein
LIVFGSARRHLEVGMARSPSRTIATTLGVAALSTCVALGAARLAVDPPRDVLAQAADLVRPLLVAQERPALRRLDDPETTGSVTAASADEAQEPGPVAVLPSP